MLPGTGEQQQHSGTPPRQTHTFHYPWIPASAGMTEEEGLGIKLQAIAGRAQFAPIANSKSTNRTAESEA